MATPHPMIAMIPTSDTLPLSRDSKLAVLVVTPFLLNVYIQVPIWLKLQPVPAILAMSMYPEQMHHLLEALLSVLKQSEHPKTIKLVTVTPWQTLLDTLPPLERDNNKVVPLLPVGVPLPDLTLPCAKSHPDLKQEVHKSSLSLLSSNRAEKPAVHFRKWPKVSTTLSVHLAPSLADAVSYVGSVNLGLQSLKLS